MFNHIKKSETHNHGQHGCRSGHTAYRYNMKKCILRATGNFASVALLFLLLTPINSFSKSIKFDITASSREIFAGESVTLNVKVSDFKEGMDPDLSKIKNCTVEFKGASSQSFQNISIINGRRLVTGFSGRNFSYKITPNIFGRIKLGPITVSDNKHSKTHSGPFLTVKGIEKQEYVQMDIVPSKNNLIVDEPFSVSLKILIKALPKPYRKAPPLSVANPPRINIPYITKDFFKGLQEPDIQKKLQAMVINDSDTPGFSINDFTFNSFFNNSLARFDFKPKIVTQNGKTYFEYLFPLNYIPTTEGEYNFGPVSFKGLIYIGATSQGKGITKSIYTIAKKITVKVVPPPIDGRPASYIGAIGTKLTAKASLDAQTCKVGDPLTLTLLLSGNIQMDNIYTPSLTLQKNLNKDFRIYEDSAKSETKGDQRTYKYTVRPSKAGTLEFPPIEISFYNPDLKKYQTVTTAPIPIRANPATEFKESTVIDTADQSVTIIAKTENPDLEVTAPFSMESISKNKPIFIPKLHLTLLLLGPLLLLIKIFIKSGKKLMPSAAKTQRHRTATSNTIKNLKGSTSHDEIVSALRQYLNLRLDISSNSLTPAELTPALLKHNISEKSAQTFANILESNFNAGFQTTTKDSDEIKKEIINASEIIKIIENELRHSSTRKRFIPFSSAIFIAILLLTTVANTASAQPTKNMEFESQLATTQLLSAKKPAQFDNAANTLKRIIDSGIRNAPLFYNYGTALLMADKPQAALNAFIRAERYSGTTWELKRNMLIAIGKMDDKITDPTLPWYRIPLFWHYGISARKRLTVACAAFLVMWIALLLNKTRFIKSRRIIFSIAIVILIIFGTSTITTLYEENSPAKIIVPHNSQLPIEVNNEN